MRNGPTFSREERHKGCHTPQERATGCPPSHTVRLQKSLAAIGLHKRFCLAFQPDLQRRMATAMAVKPATAVKASQQAPAQQVKTQEITGQQSLVMMINLMRASVGEVCYLRNLFDDSIFETAAIAGVPVSLVRATLLQAASPFALLLITRPHPLHVSFRICRSKSSRRRTERGRRWTSRPFGSQATSRPPWRLSRCVTSSPW